MATMCTVSWYCDFKDFSFLRWQESCSQGCSAPQLGGTRGVAFNFHCFRPDSAFTSSFALVCLAPLGIVFYHFSLPFYQPISTFLILVTSPLYTVFCLCLRFKHLHPFGESVFSEVQQIAFCVILHDFLFVSKLWWRVTERQANKLFAALWQAILFACISNSVFSFLLSSVYFGLCDGDTTAKVLEFHSASDSRNMCMVALYTWSCFWNFVTFLLSTVTNCSFISNTNIAPSQDLQVIWIWQWNISSFIVCMYVCM